MTEATTVYYHITEYLDEIPPHKGTLEDAAHFLQTGCFDRETKEPEEYWKGPLPMAKPGDIIGLSTLTVLFDTTARRRTLDDDARVWEFDQELPEDCDFIANRYGPGLGWPVDTIASPGYTLLNTHLNEVSETYWDGEDVIEDIVVARAISPYLMRSYSGTNPDVDDQANGRDTALHVASLAIAAMRPAVDPVRLAEIRARHDSVADMADDEWDNRIYTIADDAFSDRAFLLSALEGVSHDD